MKKKIYIGIAEDHKIVRQGFVKMLNDQKHIKILFEANNGEELLKCLEKFKPSLILLDIAMPVMDGFKTLQVVTKKHPGVKVVVFSSHYNEFYISELILVKIRMNGFTMV